MSFDIPAQYYLYLSIPPTCAVLGYVTNWLAIQMSFYPLKFVGIPPILGWQGTVPRNARRMALRGLDIVRNKLIHDSQLFEGLSPEELAVRLEGPLRPVFSDMTEQFGKALLGPVWSVAPGAVRRAVSELLQRRGMKLARSTMESIQQQILPDFDAKPVVLQNLTGKNVANLVELCVRTGGPELKVIIRSGLYLGFVLGLAQTVLWHFYGEPWILPAIGVVVGYSTNWIALRMILYPREERSFIFFRYQGMFHRRRDQVADAYASMLSEKVLPSEDLVAALTGGELGQRIQAQMREDINRALDEEAATLRALCFFSPFAPDYDAARESILAESERMLPAALDEVSTYVEDNINLEERFAGRIKELAPPDYENILRDSFRDDEHLLFMLGGFIGMIIGFLQIPILS